MPTPCTVTGNLQTLSSGQINAGAVRFQLSNIGTGNPVGIIGTSLIPQLVQTFSTDNTGAFSCAIWGNDNINPANTVYLVTFLDGLGNSVGPIQYSLTGSSVNLNTAIAGNTTSPPVLIGGPAIVSAPLAPQTITGQPLTLTNAPLTLTNPGVFNNAATRSYLSSLINGCDPTVEIGGNANAVQAITGCVKVPAGATNNNSSAIVGFANSSADSASGTHGNAAGGYFAGVAHANNAAVWGMNAIAADIAGLSGHWITGNEIDVGVSPGSTPALVRGIVITSNQSPGIMANSIGIELNPRPGGFSWGSGIMLDRGVSGNGLLLDGQDFGGNNRSQTVAFIGYDGGNLPHISNISGTANGDLQLQPSAGNGYFVLVSGGGFQLPGSSSGQAIIKAPAVAGTPTLTLPTATGTLLSTGSGAGNLVQTKRTAGCATTGGATPFTGPCTTTVTWPNTFADGNYTVTCTGNGIGAGVPILQATTTVIGASTIVQTQQATGVNASFTNIECIAIHD